MTDELCNSIFRTATKVFADIHGGGNFFWETYHDRLVINEDNSVELYRVTEQVQGVEKNAEELMYKGTCESTNGYYTADIELQHIKHRINLRYGAQLVEPGTLICHGGRKSDSGSGYTFESEIFTRMQ